MFGRKQLDEMEQDIRNRSMVVSYRFTELILAAWIVICLVMKRSCVLPAYVLISQLVVRGVSAIIYKRQVGDDRWKRALIAIIMVLLVTALIMMVGVGKAV